MFLGLCSFKRPNTEENPAAILRNVITHQPRIESLQSIGHKRISTKVVPPSSSILAALKQEKPNVFKFAVMKIDIDPGRVSFPNSLSIVGGLTSLRWFLGILATQPYHWGSIFGKRNLKIETTAGDFNQQDCGTRKHVNLGGGTLFV